ncbi:MAG: hypothetical protein ACP5HU_10135 [Phycisphaerae bacterium]
MTYRLLVSVALVGIFALVLAGCGDDATETPEAPEAPESSAPGDQGETVKTMDEYRSQAAEEITEENAEDELRRLEEEIESDL